MSKELFKVLSSFSTYTRKHLLKVLLLLAGGTVLYLTLDFYGPQNIYLKSENVFGLDCLKARDLIVQHYDNNGDLWATRGMIIYKLIKGESKFFKVSHVPTGCSILWLNNFSLVRRYFHRIECMEIITSDKFGICAFSAGRIWILPVKAKRFEETLKLKNFGIKSGRGIMSTGIFSANDSLLFFGEYFSNPNRTNVKIFRSFSHGNLWEIAYNFPEKRIRHIHALQQDPYTGNLWICTGDTDNESIIGYSSDNYHSISQIGSGSQIWRACQLVFTEKRIYWGTDTGIDLSGIYYWEKESNELKLLTKVEGAIFFSTRLENGTIVMSTDREGAQNEKDDKTRLFIISNDNRATKIDFGSWDYKKKGLRASFAKLRFQRNQGGSSLAITVMNQKEFSDSDLVIISEDVLIEASNRE
jgi:hypothetical protein